MSLNFMATVTICNDFGAPKKIKSWCFHCLPIYLTWSDWTRCHDHSFLNLVKPTFSLSSFTFIQRLLSFSLFFTIRVVSFDYLKLLIFLPAILVPACALSIPAFCKMYSAYKLNKQGDSIQPWRTPFPIWNQSVVPCLALAVASWPVYGFLKRQVRWSDIPISLSILQVRLQQHVNWELLVENT